MDAGGASHSRSTSWSPSKSSATHQVSAPPGSVAVSDVLPGAPREQLAARVDDRSGARVHEEPRAEVADDEQIEIAVVVVVDDLEVADRPAEVRERHGRGLPRRAGELVRLLDQRQRRAPRRDHVEGVAAAALVEVEGAVGTGHSLEELGAHVGPAVAAAGHQRQRPVADAEDVHQPVPVHVDELDVARALAERRDGPRRAERRRGGRAGVKEPPAAGGFTPASSPGSRSASLAGLNPCSFPRSFQRVSQRTMTSSGSSASRAGRQRR